MTELPPAATEPPPAATAPPPAATAPPPAATAPPPAATAPPPATRWGALERIALAIISVLAAAAIPGAVEVYKTRLEIAKTDKEIALKDKELEVKKLEAHNTYTSNFLNTALNQDIELRLRFAEYFAFVSDPSYREGWEKFRVELVKRRNSLRGIIDQKEREFQKVRLRRTLLTPDEQTEVDELERQLRWFYSELGHVRQDSNVSLPVPRTFEDFGKGFNGPLVPVSAASLANVFGKPTNASLPSSEPSSSSGTSACLPIDGEKLRKFTVEHTDSRGEKIDLIKPAAESLGRIMSKLMKEDPELANSVSFVKRACADYNTTRKAFDVSSWLVTVTLGGKFTSGPGFRLTGILITLTDFFLPTDPFALASLEKVARYFREEQWYWDVEDRVKRPNTFIVSASLFNKWVSAGELK
jgi:hypothetical protein